MVNTDGSGLSADNTLWHWSLSSSSSDSNSVDNITILGLVAESSGFVGPGGVVDSSNDGKLSVFPSSDSHDESHEIRLLLSPEFFEILVGSHWLVVNNRLLK